MVSEHWDRSELLSLLSSSATLAGLCITVVALMNTFDKDKSAATVADDMLAACAVGFLLCTYAIFWALRARSRHTAIVLTKVVDGVFLVSLSVMTLAAFVMAYTLW
ncbi:MAG: hypothetical protein QM803_12030 [Rhodocyclaceae bacterium]